MISRLTNFVFITVVLAVLISCGDEGDTEGLRDEVLLNQLGLTRIEISPTYTETLSPANSIYFSVSDTEQLKATGYNDANDGFDITQDVVWSSADTAIATVNGSGLLTTSVTPGTVNITATLSSLSSLPQTINVSDAAVTAVEIRESALTTAVTTLNVDVCKNVQLQAVAVYGTESTRLVTHKVAWTTTAAAAEARVSDTTGSKGLLGTSTLNPVTPYEITATFSGAGSATVNVTAINTNDALSAVAVTPSPATVAVNETQQFTATGTYASGDQDISANVSWNSSQTNFATIDADGLITGESAGDTNVSAACGGFTSAPSVVTVEGTSALIRLEIDRSAYTANGYVELDLGTNNQAQLNVTAFYDNDTSADVTDDADTSWTIRNLPTQGTPIRIDNSDTSADKGTVTAQSFGIAEVVATHHTLSDTIVVVVQ